MEQFVIGLDFGTDSVRAVMVNTLNGETIASQVHLYKRWKEGQFCNPGINQYRQHPKDHIEGIESTITGVLKESQVDSSLIKGICVDTTGSSPIAMGHDGKPLCFQKDFESNPNAMVVLWKDHTAVAEADEINLVSRTWGGTDFTKFEGGIYSSEWFWAKILHIVRQDEEVKSNAVSWMEHCDLMTHLLVGSPGMDSFKRSRCAAGHKAMWHESWEGLPDDEFLKTLDPHLVEIKNNLFSETHTSDVPAGNLSPEWASKLGLHEQVVVAVGTFDAHAGAVGAEVEEKTLVRVMGTSTCDIIVSNPEVVGDHAVRGICGQVDGSVIPGMIGLEAGQSAFGDLLAWYRDLICWPLENLSPSLGLTKEAIERAREDLIGSISDQAAKIKTSEHGPLALDWINGRRTPDANQNLKAVIANLNLGSGAPDVFKALVESICFGSKMIVERFQEEGVEIDSVVGIGGVAKKSGFIMQTLADVLQMPIKVARSEQAPALGAAMYAATAAGIYGSTEEASRAMGNGFEKTYEPDLTKKEIYQKRYLNYKNLGKFVEQTTTENV